MNRAIITACAAASLAAAAVVQGDPTGTLDTSLYGTVPAAIQANPTGFGDATGGTVGGVVDSSSGSELDAAYARVLGGYLNVFFAGNIESNFNHLEIFIDAGNGGVNTIPAANYDQDYGALNRMGTTGTNKGLTFDTGFNAGYYLGAATGGGTQFYINYETIPTTGIGTGSGTGGSGTTATDPTTGISAAINDSNVGGVTGAAADPAAAASVQTGVEFRIPLAALGNPTGPLKITAFINATDHTFVSNQVLGSLPASTSNLGNPQTVDFSAIAGNQYFVAHVIPGDANDNGRIDADDYALTDRGFGAHLSGWLNGDFNDDGQVDSADYLLLDASYLQQGGGEAGLLAARSVEFGPDYVASLLAAVPEPALVTSLAAMLVVAAGARRRNR